MSTENTTVITAADIPAIQAEAQSKLPPEAVAPVIPGKSEIPEGFPAKFVVNGKPDYAAFAKSYGELEKKLSAPKDEKKADAPKDEGKKDEPEADEKKPDEESKDGDKKPDEKAKDEKKDDKAADFLSETDLNRYTEEFTKSGDLSEDSIKELTEKYKLPRSLVDAHLQGLRHTAEAERNKLTADIGGNEVYEQMGEWARENLSAEEIEAYDKTITGSDLGAAKFAINGLYARYQAAGNVPPKQVLQGNASKGSGVGFRSTQELTHAVGDPRYQSDPAYRAEVEAKLRASRF
jgi:hypothetical protein